MDIPTGYTLTGAQDWPMLITTMKLASGIVGGLLSSIIGLLGAFWLDFRNKFATHVKEGEKSCGKCKVGIDEEFDAIWDTIDTCFPRVAGAASKRKKKVAPA
jgi:hypothetical protein